MRHLALLAAAVLPLASGCVSSTPMEPLDGSMTIYWNFTSWDHLVAGDYTSTNPGCLEAGVEEIDVEIWDARNVSVYWMSHFCQASNGVPGAMVPLFPGSYTYEAIAYRGHDHNTAVPVFSTTGGFTVASGFDTPVDATLDILVDGLGVPVPQPLLVLYSRDGAVTCSGVGGVNYSVSDVIGPVQGGTVACNGYNELTVVSASGMGTLYTVDYLQLLDPTNTFSLYEVCQRDVLNNGFAAIIDLPPTVAPGCR